MEKNCSTLCGRRERREKKERDIHHVETEQLGRLTGTTRPSSASFRLEFLVQSKFC